MKSMMYWVWRAYTLYAFISVMWLMTVGVSMSWGHTVIGLSVLPWLFISLVEVDSIGGVRAEVRG